MKIIDLWIEDYNLLKDFKIELNEQLIVLIGQNGSGKSTLLEFIAKIFYDLYEHFVLIKGQKPQFDFKLRYMMEYSHNNYEVYITANKLTKEYYEINIKKEDEKSKKYSKVQIDKEFGLNGKDGYKNVLPQNLVMYYSGISRNLENRFKIFQEENIINKSLDGTAIEKPFFYFLRKNFSAILIGLLSYEFNIPEILKKQFNILGLESISITIKKPSWANPKVGLAGQWGLKGDLANFLIKFMSYETMAIDTSFDNLMFILDSKEKLYDLMHFYGEEKKLFEYITTLQANGLIDNIEIMINKDGKIISYNNLSEGEKQLLIILGLKELLATENTLFLLDEPDTYLHPKWQREFIQNVLLQEMDSKSSFIISSHSANIISGLKKRQLKIINKENNKSILKDFSFNPYGKPVDQLLIDFFDVKGLRFKEVDEKINFLQKYLYSKDYSEEIFESKLEELGQAIGKDDIDYLKLKLEKIKRDKNEKNK